jgi:plasmid maintenance system antidote protein VapI
MKTTTRTKQSPAPSEVLMRNTIRELLSMNVTLYQVAMDAGVPWQTLQRFMIGERALSVRELDQLCRSLGLRLDCWLKPRHGGRSDTIAAIF